MHFASQEIGAAEPAAAPHDRKLTYVELVWYEKQIERWIRFGKAGDERILDRRRRLVGFAPGAIFAFVRWRANDVGTVSSRLDIIKAVRRSDEISTVPGVTPGGELLLRLAGWAKVKRALAAIDAVESDGIDPTDAAPDYWRQVHSRLSAGHDPEPYTAMRHRAHRLLQALDA